MDHHHHFLILSVLHRDREHIEAVLFGESENERRSDGSKVVHFHVQCTEYMECVRQNEAYRALRNEFPGRHQGVVYDLGLYPLSAIKIVVES